MQAGSDECASTYFEQSCCRILAIARLVLERMEQCENALGEIITIDRTARPALLRNAVETSIRSLHQREQVRAGFITGKWVQSRDCSIGGGLKNRAGGRACIWPSSVRHAIEPSIGPNKQLRLGRDAGGRRIREVSQRRNLARLSHTKEGPVLL